MNNVTGRTGQKCKISGIYEVVARVTTTAPIAKGNTFPPYRNEAVTWKLIQEA